MKRAARRLAAAFWGLALVAAVLWPSRLTAPLDGAPLDRIGEVIVFAIAVPFLWYLNPAFLRRRTTQAAIAALAIWKIAAWMLLPQTGLCGMFLTRYQPGGDGYRLDRSWDARTFWSGVPPSCSAIVTRPYQLTRDFPAWIVNVPFRSDYDFGTGESLPIENERPPRGEYAMAIDGFVYPPSDGTLSIEVGPEVQISGAVDGQPVAAERGKALTVSVPRGTHALDLWLDLRGPGWRFVPAWNGSPMFDAIAASIAPMPPALRAIVSVARWIPALLIVLLLAGWSAAAVRDVAVGRPAWLWAIGSSAVLAVLGSFVYSPAARVAPIALLGSALLPIPPRARTLRTALIVVGLPWMAFVFGRTIDDVGRFSLFNIGDDPLMFQRFAHRAFFDGYWIEAGERVFRWQPLYRWIDGVLHLAFGDSSVGETLWDGAALLVGALFAFDVSRRLVDFRAGVIAAAVALATLALEPTWYLLGRGLADVSAAGFIYLGAFALRRARERGAVDAMLGGLCASLAFLTRVNHLPLVLAMVLLLLPDALGASAWIRVREVWASLPKRAAGIYAATLAAGTSTLGLRHLYYTGQFHLFGGMGISHGTTGLASSPAALLSTEAWRRSIESVMMVVTVQDPPRFDPRGVFVAGGVFAAAAALAGVPGFRRLPLGLAVFCVASIAFAVAVRGVGYPGRFSVHLIPIAVALAIGALSDVAAAVPSHRVRPQGVV